MSTGQWGVEATYPEDQVKRKERFLIDHPDIEIMNPSNTNGRWVAWRNGKVIASEFELTWLLDRLEEQ